MTPSGDMPTNIPVPLNRRRRNAAPLHEELALNPLWKTRLCSFYQVGTCRDGPRCSYAHGTEDLRASPDFERTSVCPLLLKHGTCSRLGCRYAHDGSELRASPVMLKTKMCSFYLNAVCVVGEACRFAHSVDELREAVEVQRAAVMRTKEPAQIRERPISNVGIASTPSRAGGSKPLWEQRRRAFWDGGAAECKPGLGGGGGLRSEEMSAAGSTRRWGRGRTRAGLAWNDQDGQTALLRPEASPMAVLRQQMESPEIMVQPRSQTAQAMPLQRALTPNSVPPLLFDALNPRRQQRADGPKAMDPQRLPTLASLIHGEEEGDEVLSFPQQSENQELCDEEEAEAKDEEEDPENDTAKEETCKKERQTCKEEGQTCNEGEEGGVAGEGGKGGEQGGVGGEGREGGKARGEQGGHGHEEPGQGCEDCIDSKTAIVQEQYAVALQRRGDPLAKVDALAPSSSGIFAPPLPPPPPHPEVKAVARVIKVVVVDSAWSEAPKASTPLATVMGAAAAKGDFPRMRVVVLSTTDDVPLLRPPTELEALAAAAGCQAVAAVESDTPGGSAD